MSRAFTREIDDAPPLPIEDRPLSRARNLVTHRGAALIEAEIARLDRAIAAATPETSAALHRDLRYWTARRASMEEVITPAAPTAVTFGTEVDVERGGKPMHVRIVGEDEADPAASLIAWTSPLAQALDGAEPGEVVPFSAGGRRELLIVLAVSA